jgi:hypothetical protein
MMIFRVEHKRDRCAHEEFGQNGDSLTGHGTYWGCPNKDMSPNFGLSGRAPSTRMMEYERCAVTADQFPDWIGPMWGCRNLFSDCKGSSWCYRCEMEPARLTYSDNWHIVAYWVEDDKGGIDWREDNNQIVFNPTYAEMIGEVELWEVEQFTTRELISAR